jgi:hypothetical protein
MSRLSKRGGFRFDSQFPVILIRFIRQMINEAVIDTALEMIDRYALRAYDSVQLAGCLVLSAIAGEPYTFVCSDHPLLEAARSEQLTVLDPAT